MREYNRNIFKVCDTPEKAYWLGFLLADGNVIESHKQLSLRQAPKALDQLINFIKFLEFTEFPNLRFPQGCYEFQLGSREMFKDLTQYGIIPRKNGRETIKNIPEKYMSHFIRGYADGDGCIHIVYLKNYLHWLPEFKAEIASCTKVLKQIQKIIKKHIDLEGKIYIHKQTKSHEGGKLIFAGAIRAMKYLEWIYKDSNESMRLDYKYKKYLKYLQIREKHFK